MIYKATRRSPIEVVSDASGPLALRAVVANVLCERRVAAEQVARAEVLKMRLKDHVRSSTKILR